MASTRDSTAKTSESPVSDRATEAAHEAVDQIGSRSAETEQRLRGNAHEVSERSQELADELHGYVKQKPLIAVAIAALLGFLLGAFLRRR